MQRRTGEYAVSRQEDAHGPGQGDPELWPGHREPPPEDDLHPACHEEEGRHRGAVTRSCSSLGARCGSVRWVVGSILSARPIELFLVPNKLC